MHQATPLTFKGLRSLVVGAILLSFLCMQGCGGGSSNDDATAEPRYAGIWEVAYKLLTDECGTVLDGLPGFLDQHTINQMDRSITVSSFGNLFSQATGTIRSDRSFEARELDEGDIFGDGIFCTVETGVSYDEARDDEATSRFVQTIECADGFFCSTSGIGTATRISE